MSIRGVSSPIDIAVSGLRAEAARMNVIAANIANVDTTRGPNGEPYRRQEVVLSAQAGKIAGVRIDQIVIDSSSDFKRVYQPGHPDADGEGYVLTPNVDLPVEMVHMVTASRAYQANTAVMKRYQDMADATVELLR